MNRPREQSGTDSRSIDDLLVDAVKRAELFDTLKQGRHETPELVDSLNMSRSTVHRTTRSFSEKGLLEETDDGYELTEFGHSVADAVEAFRTEVSTAYDLETFLNIAEPTAVDVPLPAFEDATVTHPKPRQPHFAVKRIIELIESSESVRLFSSIISPFYVDVAHREMLNGTEIEVIFEYDVVDIIASEYTAKATEAAETGLFEVRVRDDLPFELFIFDDRIGMAAHDEQGIARVFVESECPKAVTWAEDVYEQFKSDADEVSMAQY
ncbi:helix-turn-helix transcriptional regulator [Halorussus halophilus]|uniref:helix-turn-helix transcriptional regulator n=1 Tax=Halorussus halophilus TaxID=2650975 RepID=UPI001301268C|nr:helix-turn-helix domain-containing protein [Halorussus halophilus]